MGTEEIDVGAVSGAPTVVPARNGFEIRDRDAAATGGWRWDLTNETPWLSPEVYGILGVAPGPGPLCIQAVAQLLGDDQLRRFIGFRDRQRRAPAPFAVVVRVRRADGQIRDVAVRGWAIQGGDGPACQLLGICSDVTVAGASTTQPGILRPLPAVTLPAAVEGVCGVGADGRITFTSQTFATLMRCEGESIVGRRLHDIVHRDREGRETHSVEDCPFTPDFTESAEAVDVDFHRRDGSRSEIVYTLSLPSAPEGMGAIISMRDTAPRQEVTRRLQMSRRQVQELNEQCGALLDDLVVAEERERLRIAAELHDDTIQSLAAVALRLSNVGEQARSDVDRDLFADAEAEVREAAERLRRLMVGLMRPAPGRDLIAAIAAYCETLFAGSTMSYGIEGDAGELPEAMDLLAYRLVQEAVRNALTHSSGTRVLVSISRTPSELILGVGDDGIGMGEPHDAATHAGLRILRDRAATVGGSVRFRTGIDGRGTGVELRLPLASPSAAVLPRGPRR